MKIGTPNDVTTTGINQSQSYGVKIHSGFFQLTMEKLYANKLGSVIREVCSNAYDSHKSAGKEDVPFHITTPTQENEELTIQDFGTGLPNDRIFQLFGTMFESSKDQSNNDIGGFGLGSKSPFSIADTFTIESNWEGTKTFFLNFKDGQGIPQITITASDVTDEMNGIKIIIPISVNEHHNIFKEIKRQLAFFETKPLINGSEETMTWWTGVSAESYTVEQLSKTTRVETVSSRIFEFKNFIHLVQIGPVIYPLDLSRLSQQVQSGLNVYYPLSGDELKQMKTL